MPVIKVPPNATPEDMINSIPFPGGMAAPYISNIKGPVRQVVQQAIAEGKDPNKVAAALLRGPYSPSVADTRNFAGKGREVLEPVVEDVSQKSSTNGLLQLGGLLGILAALFSEKNNSTNPQTPPHDYTYPNTDQESDLSKLPKSDDVVKMFSKKPVGPRAVKAIKELAQSIKPEDSVEVIEAKADALDRKYFPELRQEQATGQVQDKTIQPEQISTPNIPVVETPAASTLPTPQTTPTEPPPVQVTPSTTPIEENQPKMTPQQEFDAGFREATRSKDEILQDFLDRFGGYK